MRYLKYFHESMNTNLVPFNFIRADECHIYLHTTPIEKAEKILMEGFLFTNINIMKTVDGVSCKPEDFEFITQYLLTQRNEYGEAVVIIHIGYNLMKKYRGAWEECLSEEVLEYNPEDFCDVSCVRRLDVQFIKGYFIKKTGQYFTNPEYNPTRDKPEFEQRYKEIIKRN